MAHLRYIEETPSRRSLSNGRHIVSIKQACCLVRALADAWNLMDDRLVAYRQVEHGGRKEWLKAGQRVASQAKRVAKMESLFLQLGDRLPPCCNPDAVFGDYEVGRKLLAGTVSTTPKIAAALREKFAE